MKRAIIIFLKAINKFVSPSLGRRVKISDIWKTSNHEQFYADMPARQWRGLVKKLVMAFVIRLTYKKERSKHDDRGA